MEKFVGVVNKRSWYLVQAEYRNNGNLYLGLQDAEQIDSGGISEIDVTINLPIITPKGFAFLSNDIPQEFVDVLIMRGFISPVLFIQQCNMGKYRYVYCPQEID